MSMADDNTLRSYRSNDPYRRSANPADAQDMAGSDPLAELARLIGQTDPFTDTCAGSRRRPRRSIAGRRRGDWRRHIQRPSYETRDEPAFDADPRYAQPIRVQRRPPTGMAAAAAGSSDPLRRTIYADRRDDVAQQDATPIAHADYRGRRRRMQRRTIRTAALRAVQHQDAYAGVAAARRR